MKRLMTILVLATMMAVNMNKTVKMNYLEPTSPNVPTLPKTILIPHIKTTDIPAETFTTVAHVVPPTPTPVVATAAPVAAASPAPRALASSGGTCAGWLAAAGIPITYGVLELINGESGCNPNAINASSGACGIGQQLPCGKWPHTWNEPVGAMIDMNTYVVGRYGTWANAYNSWLSRNPHWY